MENEVLLWILPFLILVYAQNRQVFLRMSEKSVLKQPIPPASPSASLPEGTWEPMPGPLDTAQVTSSQPPTSQPSRKGRANKKSGKFRVFTAKRLKHNRNNKISKPTSRLHPGLVTDVLKIEWMGFYSPAPSSLRTAKGGMCVHGAWGRARGAAAARLRVRGNRAPDRVTACPLTPPSCPTCCQAGSGPLQGQGRRTGGALGSEEHLSLCLTRPRAPQSDPWLTANSLTNAGATGAFGPPGRLPHP